MSPIVKCDICGQICNQSYLHAHKRLAHKKEQTVAPATHAEPETVRAYLLPGFEAGPASDKMMREGREAKQRIQ